MKDINTREEQLKIENNQLKARLAELEIHGTKLDSNRALEKSQYYFAKAQEIGKVGLWELDLIENELIWTDQNYKNFGIPIDTSLTYELFLNCVYPEDRDYVNTEWKEALKGKPYDIEHRLLIDGDIRWLRERAQVNYDTDGKPISAIGFTQDITDRKNLETTLKEKEEFLNRTGEIAKVGGWQLVDNFTRVEWTKTTGEIHELPEGVFPSLKDAINYYHPDDRDTVSKCVTDAIEKGKPYDFATRFITEKGNLRWIRIIGRPDMKNGTVFRQSGTFQDITKSKQAEEKLKTSEERLRTILDSNPFPIAVVDVNDDKITHWSTSAKQLFGHNPKNTQEWYELAYPDLNYRNEAIKRWKPFLEIAAKQSEAVNTGEYQIVCKDGTTKICELYAQFIPGSLIVTLNDITERKQAEKAKINAYKQIEESEEKYRLLFERDIDAIFIYNPETTKIIDANKATSELYGYSPEELLGKSVLEFSAEVEQSRAQLKNIKKNGQIQISLRKHKKKDGSIIYVEVKAFKINLQNKDAMFAITKNITSKVMAEEALKKQNKEFEAINKELSQTNKDLINAKEKAEENRKSYEDLVQTSHNLIWKCDVNGKFTFLNIAWENTLGYKVEEMLGRPFSDFQRSEVFERDVIEFKKHLEGGSVNDYETTYITKNGNGILLLFNAIPLANSKGEIIGTQGTAFDISKLKQVEKELRRSEEELKKAQQITHIGSWYLDIETNQVVWSDELYKMYGFDPVLPVPPYTEHMKLFTPESWELLSESLANTQKTGIPYELELKTIRNDGTNGWMWVRGEAVLDNKGKIIGLWGAAQDISERKNIENDLYESQVIFKNFMDFSPIYVFFKDENMRAIQLSKNFESMLNKPLEDLLGKNMNELFPSDLAKNMIADDIKVLRENKVVSVEEELNGRNYTTIKFPINISGKPSYLAGYTIDITEKKKAEEELKKHRDKLEELVKERTKDLEEKNKELERFNNLFVGRELRIKELKERIKELEG